MKYCPIFVLQDRDLARELHAAAELPFFEVFVNTPLEECEKRDVGSLTRLFADQADPPVVTHFSKYGNVYTGLTSIVTILGGFGWIADRLEKRLEKSIKDSDTQSKERTDKLEKSIKDSDTQSKERTEKVEQRLDGISRDIRENTQSVHARIDHVLLTALKLRSVPPPGE